MRPLFGWLSNRWANYKYRFTPWIALNLDREAVKLDFELASPQVLLQQLHQMLEALHHYTALRDDLMLYDELHQRNQERVLECFGFCLSRCPSSLPGAGSGVKLIQGKISKGRTWVQGDAISPNPALPVSTRALCTNPTNQFCFSLLETGSFSGARMGCT